MRQSNALADALALITASYFDVQEGYQPIIDDWTDNGAATPETRSLAAALTFWAGTLFTRACEAAGHDPEKAPLVVPVDQDADLGTQRDAVAVVIANLAGRTDITGHVYKTRLTSRNTPQEVRAFVLALARVSALLLDRAAEANYPSAGALLEQLAAGCVKPTEPR